jgi:hypothetical protein
MKKSIKSIIIRYVTKKLSANKYRIKEILQNGGKVVSYSFAISIIIMTFKRSSPLHAFRANEGCIGAGFKYSLLTLLLGWWRIP